MNIRNGVEVSTRLGFPAFLIHFCHGFRLYAYTQKMYHGREIARQLEVHLPLMWLSGFQKPDFRSINRFRSERMKDLIDDLFREMITLLVADGYVKM
ncbi:transposase, partial [Geobacillus stearothermophilus]